MDVHHLTIEVRLARELEPGTVDGEAEGEKTIGATVAAIIRIVAFNPYVTIGNDAKRASVNNLVARQTQNALADIALAQGMLKDDNIAHCQGCIP